MKLLRLKTAIEYRPAGEEDLKVRVKHYIVELSDKEYHALLTLTKGQER